MLIYAQPPVKARKLSSTCPNSRNQPTEPTLKESVVLTPCQKEVLELVVEGYSDKEIAGQLNLTERTVKYHVSHILERYQLNSSYELSHLYKDSSNENTA